MTVTAQRVTCKCGNVCDVEIVTNAPLSVTIASMNSAKCSKCGSQELMLGGSCDDAPPLSASVAVRAGWWIRRGDTGTSSLTIWCAFTGGVNPHDESAAPRDPDDFSRCYELFKLIPEWRADLATVTKYFKGFGPFEKRWAEFEKLYEEEEPSGTCPKLYKAMQVGRKASRK